ncbi:MAG: hypothetical protein WBF53_13850 [Litorimonas sp.]
MVQLLDIIGDKSTDGVKLNPAGDDIVPAGNEVKGLFNEVTTNGEPSNTSGSTSEGTNGDDRMVGGPAKNVVNGKSGDDFIDGKGGRDALFGGSGDDVVKGGDGNDVLTGNSGDDKVVGGKGNDVVIGGTGDDTLIGGKGDDDLIGGEGEDTFVFKGGRIGDDTVHDFELGVDKLKINAPQKFTFDVTNEADDLVVTYIGGGNNEVASITFVGLGGGGIADAEGLSLAALRTLFDADVVTVKVGGNSANPTTEIITDTFDFGIDVIDIQGPAKFDFQGGVNANDDYELVAFGNGGNKVNTIIIEDFTGDPVDFDTVVAQDGIGTEMEAEYFLALG